VETEDQAGADGAAPNAESEGAPDGAASEPHAEGAEPEKVDESAAPAEGDSAAKSSDENGGNGKSNLIVSVHTVELTTLQTKIFHQLTLRLDTME
jgi:hypothetical protein